MVCDEVAESLLPLCPCLWGYLCRSSTVAMSYQVRRLYESTSSRFRSAGFHSVSPPVENNEQLGASKWFEPVPRRRKTCLKSAATKLDPALWKFLPDDVFPKVVGYMPFPGVLRCRAVSKQCKEFVLSERFQEARACVKSWEVLEERTQHLLVFATIKGVTMCTAYDAAGNRWLRMPPMRGLDPRAKDCIAGECPV